MSGLAFRLGLIGVGRIGAEQAAVLARHPEVAELVVADTDPARAAHVAATLGVTAAVSIDALFALGLDGVAIASPTSTHAELILRSIPLGVPIFCEKPVALDVSSTAEVIEEITRTGASVQIGFQRRFDAGYAAARERLRSGALGELRRAHLLTCDPEPPHASFVPTSGGIFRDCHVHDFDIIRWVSGHEVVEVYATGSNRGADFFAAAGDVDESVAVLTLDDGTLATTQGSRYNGAGYDVRMELAGTLGTAAVGLDDRVPLRSTEPGATFPPAGPRWGNFWERFTPAYTAELAAFVDVVAGRRESPCTAQDALEALLVAEAATLSVKTHRPVRIDEVRPAPRG